MPKKNIFLLIFQVILEGKKLGNDNEIEVFVISIVCLKTNSNLRLVLNDIKHTPNIRTLMMRIIIIFLVVSSGRLLKVQCLWIEVSSYLTCKKCMALFLLTKLIWYIMILYQIYDIED